MRSTHGYVGALGELDSSECEDFLEYPAHRKLLKLLRLRARNYDYVFLPYPAARWQYHAGALLLASGRLLTHEYRSFQRWVPGYKFTPPVIGTEHVVAANARLLAGVGISPDIEMKYIEPSRWQLPSRQPRRRVAFHLVSLDSAINKGNAQKSPPLATYAAVAAGLKAAGYEVCAVGTGKERAVAGDFSRLCGFPIPFISGTLEQTARQLRECALVIAAESGIAHLAAAIKAPLLCVFGMTDPRRFAPLAEDVYPIRMSECPPCYDPSDRQFACKLGIAFRCVREDLPAEAILRRALEIMSSAGSFVSTIT